MLLPRSDIAACSKDSGNPRSPPRQRRAVVCDHVLVWVQLSPRELLPVPSRALDKRSRRKRSISEELLVQFLALVRLCSGDVRRIVHHWRNECICFLDDSSCGCPLLAHCTPKRDLARILVELVLLYSRGRMAIQKLRVDVVLQDVPRCARLVGVALSRSRETTSNCKDPISVCAVRCHQRTTH